MCRIKLRQSIIDEAFQGQIHHLKPGACQKDGWREKD